MDKSFSVFYNWTGSTLFEQQKRFIPLAAGTSDKQKVRTIMATPQTSQIDGLVFAAQSCSCNCDPCICGDTCSCHGADAYLGPRWRFVGDIIHAGIINEVDISQRLLLNLAQTSSEHDTDWHDVILIDDGATPEQVQALLQQFDAHQGSRIADTYQVPDTQRPVYLAPMHYVAIEGRHMLMATFSPERSQLLRGEHQTSFFQPWTYNGHIAVREPIEEWLSASTSVASTEEQV